MANNFEDFILENVINRIDDVWLLYRPSYYKIFKDEQGYDVTNIADLHLYKGGKKFQKRNLSLTFLFQDLFRESSYQNCIVLH